MQIPILTQPQIEQIARILGDTEIGYPGSEIGHLLVQCRMQDPNPELTKWKRLYNAFCLAVNNDRSTNIIYAFIKHCFEPAQGLRMPERYNWMRLGIIKVKVVVSGRPLASQSVRSGTQRNPLRSAECSL